MNFCEVLELENGFPEWRKLAESVGVDGSSQDWKIASSIWKTMDFEQRQKASDGIAERRGYPDDSVIKSLPQNILADRKYERKFRVPVARNNPQELSVMERMKRLKEREAKEARERQERDGRDSSYAS